MKNFTKKAILFLITLSMTLGAAGTLGVNVASAGTTDNKLSVTKTINWTPGSDEASVEITSNVPDVGDTKVLFIGTLCNAHGMESDTIRQSLNAIANNADVTYYLLNADDSSKDYKVADKGYGTLERGSSLKEGDVAQPTSAGNHASLKGFINVLYKEIVDTSKTASTSNGKYDYIILEFDSSRLADGYSASQSAKMNTLANILKEYYANDKVIWVTDGRQYTATASERIDTSKKVKITDQYTPSNLYFTNSDSKIKALTASQFRSLCSIIAPKYYIDHTTADATYYGSGKGTNTEVTDNSTSVNDVKKELTDYSLPTVTRYTEGTNKGKINTDSYETARQLNYNDAGDMSEFLYMAIEGIALKFIDTIKFPESVSVTGATLSQTKDSTAATAAAATDWTQLTSLNVANALGDDKSGLKTDSSGVKYVTNDNTKNEITVTTENDTKSKDNVVTVNATDIKSRVKYLKIVINLKSSNYFIDCITPKMDGETQAKDKDGNLLYEMNPNNGNAQVNAYSDSASMSDTAAASLDVPATAIEADLLTVTSQVTNGTKSHEGTALTDGLVKTSDRKTATTEEKNPLTIYSYSKVNGTAVKPTVTTTYTPDENCSFDNITIDGKKYETKDFEVNKLSGTGFEVTLNNDGTVTAKFADMTTDHTVSTVFKYCISIKKTVSQTTAKAGDALAYTIKLENDSTSDITGYKVTDDIDSNLELVSVTYGGNTYKDGDTGGKTLSVGNISLSDSTLAISNLTIPAKSDSVAGSLVITVNTKVKSDITETKTIKNTASGTDSNKKKVEASADDVTAYPVWKLSYEYVGTAPSAAVKPSDAKEYTAADNEATVQSQSMEGVAGWVFSGWHEDNTLTSDVADGAKLTMSGDRTLYGEWTPALTIDKSVSTGTTVLPWDIITYTITVKNTGKETLTDIIVEDKLPEGLSRHNWSDNNTGDYANVDSVNGTSYEYKIKSLAENESCTFSYTVMIPDNQDVKSYTNTAKIKSFKSGETTITNVNPEDSATTNMSDYIKVAYHFVDKPYSVNDSTDMNSLLPANDYLLKDTAYTSKKKARNTTDPIARAGYIFDGWYTDSSCAADKKYTDGTVLSANTDLYGKWTYAVDVKKELINPTDAANIKAGDALTYKITVTNESNADLKNYEITDTIDKDLDFVSVSYGGKTYTKEECKKKSLSSDGLNFLEYSSLLSIGKLTIPAKSDAGAGKLEINVVAKVKDTLTNSDYKITNKAIGSDNYNYELDSKGNVKTIDTESNTVENNIYELKVEKDVLYGTTPTSVAGGTVNAGSTVTYSVKVTNMNPGESTTATIVDKVPAGLTVVPDSLTASGGVYDSKAGTITWTDKTIDKSGELTLTFNATVPSNIDEVQTYENKAYVSTIKVGDTDKTYDDPFTPGVTGDSDNPATVSLKGIPTAVVTVSKEWSDTWDSHSDDTVKVYMYKQIGSYDKEKVEEITLSKTNQSESRVVQTKTSDNKDIKYSFSEVVNNKTVADGDMNGKYKVSYTITGGDTVIKNTYQITPADITFEKKTEEITSEETKQEVSDADSGETFYYVLSIENNRTYETANNLVIEDIVPAGLTVLADPEYDNNKGSVSTDATNSNKLTWTISSLLPQEELTLRIKAKIAEDTEAAEFVNVAEIKKIGDTSYTSDNKSPEAKTKVRSFKVTKSWCDKDGKAISGDALKDMPEVKVSLYQSKNGETPVKLDRNDATQTLNNTNGWTYKWTKLPLYDSNNNLYDYTVVEESIEGYTTAYSYGKASNVVYGNTKGTITNTLRKVTINYQFVSSNNPKEINIPDSEEVGYGTKYKAADAMKSAGYEFAGWYADSECNTLFGAEKVLNEANCDSLKNGGTTVTLYGKWTKIVNKIHYDPSGGTGAPRDEEINYFDSVTVSEIKPTKAGLTFLGWSTKENATTPDPDLDPEDLIKNANSDEGLEDGFTLYAVWGANVSYQFVGDVPSLVKVPDSENIELRTKYTAASKPTRLGYKFEGWYTDSGCTLAYVDGTEISENTILYGKWTKEPTIIEQIKTGDASPLMVYSLIGLIALFLFDILLIIRVLIKRKEDNFQTR